MPVDGCVYLKASDGTMVPLTRVGPQGPKGDPGIPVAPTAADEGKVLVARSQSAVWESMPGGGANTIVLGPGDPVPAGTPAGTVIVRTEA